MTLDTTTGELVPVPELITAASPGAAAELQRRYHELCKALLDRNDFQVVGDREFKKKSAWRKLATAFNVSTEILEEDETFDEDGRIIRAKFKVRASAPNGRFMDGIGLCSIDEKGLVKTEHVIIATAHTRAVNRACADLFGLGEVSAEEVQDSRTGSEPAPAQRRRPVPTRLTPTSSKRGAVASLDELGVRALGDRLAMLPEANRIEFKEWRRAKGYDWEPQSAAVFDAMVEWVARVEVQLGLDEDTYGA